MGTTCSGSEPSGPPDETETPDALNPSSSTCTEGAELPGSKMMEKAMAEEERKRHAAERKLLEKWKELIESEKDRGLCPGLKDLDNMELDDPQKFVNHIAERRSKKRLFVCCDGTLQDAAGKYIAPQSNVARLARSVHRIGDDPIDSGTVGGVPQLVYYSSGIGSHSALHLDGIFAAVTGKGFSSTILNAYCFISNNYSPSLRDDIILVGYSRGAFAMRCLAHFISEVGLLLRRGLGFVGVFYDLWLRDDKEALESKKLDLNHLFFTDVKIQVLAEWDPVNSLIWSPFRSSNRLIRETTIVPKKVKNAFVAISLHEKRWAFRPVVWEHRRTYANKDNNQNVQQCAFLGSHSDIGGSKDAGLSTISLFWMVAKIKEASSARFDYRILEGIFIPEKKVQGIQRLLTPWKKVDFGLSNQMVSKGNVSETSCLWHLPNYLTLRLFFKGNRRQLLMKMANHPRQFRCSCQPEQKNLEQANSDKKTPPKLAGLEKCGLDIHKTVRIMIKHRAGHSKPESLSGFEFRHNIHRWTLKKNRDVGLQETELMKEELALLKDWVWGVRVLEEIIEEMWDIPGDEIEHNDSTLQEGQKEEEDIGNWKKAIRKEGTSGLKRLGPDSGSLAQFLDGFFELPGPKS
ncbi:hypothetical protein F5Y00DRAFT_259118 [Daldinia vernicosa]|uniref:uncharacterized protein n=1 Tax=Daldinia vernicosa TaxID=114800 RepID=UPI002007D9A7|nr:uncharacterized protein F5Y00DRAFT_259118 [Daldinia vernicosa]KAI0851629.1 hypothetical protein F5Y00DRAFT_259118 [Daldinia vernicosa]